MRLSKLALLIFMIHQSAMGVERPSLLFGPGDIPELQQRATQEPHRSAYLEFKRVLDQTSGRNSAEDMQLAALAYTITGNTSYATMAKNYLNSWLTYYQTNVPTWSGTTSGGALGVSRQAIFFCFVFDMIQPSGVYSASEEQYVQDVLHLCASRLMERGQTFNPYDYWDMSVTSPHPGYWYRMDNYNTARYSAIGMFALTFPDNPESSGWLAHAIDEFNWQLDNSVMDDGFWSEGSRYHGDVLRHLLPFAYALKRTNGIDMFANQRFKAMFEALIHYQTPLDATMGNVALLPALADSNWDNVWESVIFGWATSAYADSDPNFASRLKWAWQRAGSPFTIEYSGSQIAGFLLTNHEVEAIAQPDLTSEVLTSGYTIFRDGFDSPDESYFLLSVATYREHLGHHHWDNGSFSLYAWNTPLSLDPGSYDYSLLWPWYQRSKAHNQVLFNDSDCVNTENGAVSNYLMSTDMDYVDADLTNPTAAAYHRRVFFVKPSYYLIWDDIASVQPAQYQLHVLTENLDAPTTVSSGSPSLDKVLFECQNDIDLEVEVLSPENVISEGLLSISDDPYPTEFYGIENHWPGKVYEKTQKWIKLDQSLPGEDFVTILYPKKATSPELQLLRFQQTMLEGSLEEQWSENFDADPGWLALNNGQNYYYWLLNLGGVMHCQILRDGQNRRRYVLLGRTYTQDDYLSLTFDFKYTSANFSSAMIGFYNSAQPDNHLNALVTDLYTPVGMTGMWCDGSYTRNDPYNPFSINTLYRATLINDPASKLATLTVTDVSSSATVEVVTMNMSGRSFEIDSIGIGNESAPLNPPTEAVVELDNFSFTAQSLPTKNCTLAKINYGTQDTTFYLNSQTHTDTNETLNGKAGIFMEDTLNTSADLFLIDGQMLQVGPDYRIALDGESTLQARCIVPGRSYILTNYGSNLGQTIEVKLPWSASLDDVHVFSQIDQTEKTISHNHTEGSIGFTMNEQAVSHPRLSCVGVPRI